MPELQEAKRLLDWALERNPGPWGAHCETVARAAHRIASACGMAAERCRVMGLVHDIGRFVGRAGVRHVIAGYDLMMEKSWPDAARACLTHSFPVRDLAAYNGEIDCTAEECARLTHLLDQAVYDDEVRLIQLCDAISLPTGVTLMEKRLMDVGLRHGLSRTTADKWRAFLSIKAHFDALCGQNIYQLFQDEVIEGIFS